MDALAESIFQRTLGLCPDDRHFNDDGSIRKVVPTLRGVSSDGERANETLNPKVKR